MNLQPSRDTPSRESAEQSRDHAEPSFGWFGAPNLPLFHILRGRLLDQLDRDDGRLLVLVSAPAGSGKTTLLADWVSRRVSDRTAWVTMDESDTGFWRGVVRCLEDLGVSLRAASMPAGSSALDPEVRRRIATTLAAEPSRVTVVVDGYEMESAAVATDVDFILTHCSGNLRLVLVTRADPVLPLYRYRLEDRLVELRMADLAFTDEEARALLAAMEVHLSRKSTHRLNRRTKGWVTGLRFAAKMLDDRSDPDAAVDDVVGYTGNIAEYLVGEVLAAHPPHLRRILMATSIPEMITPGLAEALAGRAAARSLAFLTRVNAFVEQVPGHPGTYRYHPFFRDLLRAELEYTAPETMERLQRRAARWFADEGMLVPAVQQFASAGAWQEAAGQVVEDLAVGRLLLGDPRAPLVQTLKRLPEEYDDPAARVVRASIALGEGDTERFDELIADLHDEVEQPTEQAAVSLAAAVLRALRARFADDPRLSESLAATAEYALDSPTLRRRSAAHPELAAMVFASKGIALTRQGHLQEARVTFKAGIGVAQEAECAPLLIECLGYLALIACVVGDLTRAEGLASRALEVAESAGIREADRSAAPQVARAWTAVERYELHEAAELVRSAERSDFILGDPVPRSLLALVKSRLQVAQGDRTGALARVEQGAAALTDRQRWLVDRLHLEAARLRVLGGEPEPALLELEGLSEAHAGAEFELVAVQAQRLLDETPAAAELDVVLASDAPVPVRVSGWLVECAHHLRQGSMSQALQDLRKALQLAAGMRLRRPFHEAPGPVRQLLLHDEQLTTENGWLFEAAGAGGRVPAIPRQRVLVEASAPMAPVEKLTPKELEVLGHLAEMFTTEEIAAVMYVSVNTVRTHVRNILRKLGVNRRHAAVRLARELDLLPTGTPTA